LFGELSISKLFKKYIFMYLKIYIIKEFKQIFKQRQVEKDLYRKVTLKYVIIILLSRAYFVGSLKLLYNPHH